MKIGKKFKNPSLKIGKDNNKSIYKLLLMSPNIFILFSKIKKAGFCI